MSDLSQFKETITANAVTANLTTTGNVSASNANLGNLITANYISINNTANVTGNITTSNANLGNVVIANFFIGSGNNLSNIQGSNVTGFVSNANVANTSISINGANVSGAVGLATYATTANSVAGSNVSGQVNFAATANAVAGGNVSGQVGNATIAGTVYTNAQPNITSVGTLSSLNVTANITSGNISVGNINSSGNITSANANLGNTVVANYFLGDGSRLTGLASAFTSVDIGTILTAYTGNIDGGNLIITSNISSGNANLGNAATSNYFIGSGANLTSLNGANVTGQVSYAATANSVAVANVVGIGNIATVNKDGNSSNILYGNGIFASAPVTYGNSNVATYLGSYGSNIIITTGNVTVGNIIGNGQALSGLTGANVSGAVGLATYATTANSVAGSNVSGAVSYATTANAVAGGNVSGQVGNALVAGTVYSNAQPNITSVGTLSSLTVTANITSGNANLGNLVTANYFSGAGNNLSNIQGGNVSGNVGYAVYAYSVAGANVSGTVAYATTANSVAGANVSGAVSYATVANSVAGSNVSGAVAFATTANSVAGANVSGAVAYATTANSVAGANVSGAVAYATTANSVAVGNVSGIGNIATVNKDGNSSNILYGNGVFASAPVTYGNSNVATYLGSYGSNTIVTTGNVTVGNIIGNGQALTGLAGANVSGTVANANSAAYLGTVAAASYLQVTGTGSSLTAITGANVTGAVSYATTANAVAGANVSGQVGNALVAGTVYSNAQPNITSVGTLTSLTITGNIINGNVTGGNLVSANYFTGTLTTAAQPNITSTGTLTSLSVTGNVTGGNIVSGGVANITGNITGANLIAGSSGQGNVYAGNVIVNGQPTTYGVVNGSYLFATNTSDQNNIASGTAVIFQNTGFSLGTAITKLSNTQVTLAAGNSYKLEGIFRSVVSNSTWATFQWYDVTNAAYVGVIGFGEAVTSPSTGKISTVIATYYVTPSVNTTYELRSTVNSPNVIGGEASYEITQLNPAIAVQATATGTLNNQYVNVTNAADQTVYATGTDIVWDTLSTSSGIPYSTSNGQFTLTAGSTYNIVGMFSFSGYSANGYLLVQLVDATTNTAIGNQQISAAYNTGYNEVNNISLDIVYTPGTNQTVKFRVTGGTSGINAKHRGGYFSRAAITQINQAFALNTLGTMTTTGNVTVGGNLNVTGTSTSLITKASGFVNRGVDVTLGNLKVRMASSGNASLQVSTVSGTLTVYGSSTAGGYIDGGTSPLSVTTTPAYLSASANFSAAGQTDTWVIRDTSNSIAWRITLVVGIGYNNNMISIERLV